MMLPEQRKYHNNLKIILDLHIVLYFRIVVGTKEEAVWKRNY